MLFKMGLRNIFRNPRRTLITVFALGFGIGAIIFVETFMLGMTDTMKNEVVDNLTGEIQIHHPRFVESRDPEWSFDPLPLEKWLEKNQQVAAFSKRVIATAMLASAQSSHNVSLMGIDPQREAGLINIRKVIVEGDYLSDKKRILIGTELAKNLDVRVGEKITITVGEIDSGDLVQELYRVAGIFKYGGREMDKYIAFIPLKHADSMLGTRGRVHEIAIKTHGLNDSQLSALAKKIGPGKSEGPHRPEAKTWFDLTPSVYAVIEMSSYSSSIIAFVLMIIVAFGIVNTIFMTIHERRFEFGIIKSIGTRPVQVFKMILIESFYLGAFGALIGVIVGAALTLIFMEVGVDYSEIEMGAIGFREPLRPVMVLYPFILFPLIFWPFTMIISIYPALYAAKINVVKAIRN